MARSIPEDSGALRSRVIKQTGPRTARGKAASSQNARKHGLRSKDVVIQGERPEDFDDLLQDLRRDKNPMGAVEEELVEQVANAMWRLRRARRLEAGMYADYMNRQKKFRQNVEKIMGPDTPVKDTTVSSTYGSVATSIETILRYETTIERFMFRALDRLRELQSARVTDLEPLEVTIEAESVEVSDPSDLLGDLELDADTPKP